MHLDSFGTHQRHRIALLGGACAALAILAFAVGHWGRSFSPSLAPAEAGEILTVDRGCDPGAQACSVAGGDGRLTLRFGSPIVPLEPFAVDVNLEGIAADAVTIEFRMDGMDMGMNRFDLLPIGAGIWQGEVLLPICWAGRRHWTAVVSTLSGDVTMRASFAFAVVS